MLTWNLSLEMLWLAYCLGCLISILLSCLLLRLEHKRLITLGSSEQEDISDLFIV